MDFVIRFESEAFDYRGTVPEAANAGNQFYGADLAEYLSESLRSGGYKTNVIGEDWGWLVEVASGETSSDISIGNGLDGAASASEGPGSNGWTIVLSTFVPRKVLGLTVGKKQVEPDKSICAAVERAIKSKAVKVIRAELE